MDASIDPLLAPLPSLRGFMALSATDAPVSPTRVQAMLRVLAEAARAAAARSGTVPQFDAGSVDARDGRVSRDG